MFALRSNEKWNLANYWLKNRAAPVGNQLIETLHEMNTDQHALLRNEGKEIQADIAEFITLLWVGCFLAVSLSIGIAIYMTRVITQPIKQAVKLAEKVAKGDFDAVSSSSATPSSSVETEKLLKSLQTMAQQIGDMVREIRLGESRISAIVNTAIDSIITINDRGISQTLNEATINMFGYSTEELIGKNISMLMPEPDKGRHDGYLGNYLSTGKKKVIGIGREVIGQKKDGTEVPVYLSIAAITVGGDTIFCGTLRDLTAEKLSQSQLVQSGKLASLGTLATGIAHELRQPLTVNRLNLEELLALLEDGELELDELPEYLNNMLKHCTRMNDIVNHLRGFARDGESKSIEDVDLGEVLDNSFTLLDAQMRSRGINVTRSKEDNLPVIRSNANQLEQIIINLLSNARDALESVDDPAIDIKIKTVNGHVVLTIADNGPGVPQDAQSKIFDPFFTTKEFGKGTGLGLSITHGIIADHAGKIIISDAKGGGAKFTISLPTVDDGNA